MIIIGEKLNSSIVSTKMLMENRDTEGIIKLADAQLEGGADYIDINAGMFVDKEPETLAWLAQTLSARKCPISIDTPSHEAAEAALRASGAKGSIINSVTLETGRLENMSSLAAEFSCRLVALCMQESGMPDNIDTRLAIAEKLTDYSVKKGIREEDIFIDPMLKPLGADQESGLDALRTIAQMHGHFPSCHIVCGLSNLSYGLPKRKLLNRAFAVTAICNGLDSAILDPLDRDLMGLISAAEAINGLDEYCLDYISKCREGKIG